MITLVKLIVQTLFKTVKIFKQRKKCDPTGANGAYVDIKFDGILKLAPKQKQSNLSTMLI